MMRLTLGPAHPDKALSPRAWVCGSHFKENTNRKQNLHSSFPSVVGRKELKRALSENACLDEYSTVKGTHVVDGHFSLKDCAGHNSSLAFDGKTMIHCKQ